MKVKMVTHFSNLGLEEEINAFISQENISVVDIKLTVAGGTQGSSDQLYALIMYDEK